MANFKKGIAQFNYIGELIIPLTVVSACSHSGRCDDDVKEAIQLPYIKKQLNKIDPVKLSKELKEYGAWDELERSNHLDNLSRILWIACNDIKEELV